MMDLNTLSRWVVRISAWKLFLASILFSFLIFLASALTPAPNITWGIGKIIEVTIIIGYNYLIGTSLFQRLPPKVSMNVRAFKRAISVLVFAVFSFAIVLSLFPSSAGVDWHSWTIYVLLVTSIAASCSAIYVAIFIVKEITSIELGRTAEYGDYVDLIVFSMIFPFGVWVIQRRVKRIFESNQ